MSWQAFITASLKDKDGKVVLFQRPNASIVIWFLCTIANKFIAEGTLHQTIEIVGLAALLVWCWLEIAFGTNYFRRALGATVFIFSLLLHSNAL